MSGDIGEDPSAEQFFPLRTVGDVRALFSSELSRTNPDLSLLSIVTGALEHQWTQAKIQSLPLNFESSSSNNAPNSDLDYNPCMLKIHPALEWETVQSLKAKFESIIKGFCDSKLLEEVQKEKSNSNLRPIIKHVADIVWNTLSKSQYKDRPHLQSIYSYLTANKLDCFGVSFAVVAACQLLELDNVHLALSEDHAWVVFGEDGTETAEVTWHGKGNEDKRGKPVDIEKAKSSWLYVAGQPVVCDRHMEVAALVSSINFAITANLDSIECGALQQELLWLLYDMGHLKHYPMALGNLADLEEICPSLGRPPCVKLFLEAVNVNREIFQNHHVYPYTYLAGYYYRAKEYKKALECWAQAADVIQIYRYSKDDEEIYKEFMEIANELIPHMVKSISLDSKIYNEVLKDPECFAFLIKFYDGICCWEEGSPTPVLHIGWAKHMVSSCSKFEPEIRSKVEISKEADSDDNDEGTTNETLDTEENQDINDQKIINNNYVLKDDEQDKKVDSQSNDTGEKSKCDISQENNERIKQKQVCDVIRDEEVKELSEACNKKLLNINYLLGRPKEKPFLNVAKEREILADPRKILLKPKFSSFQNQRKKRSHTFSGKTKSTNIALKLESAKMRGLQGLLCSEKINASAIQLQLTAQSQSRSAAGKGHVSADTPDIEGRPKRVRRD